MSRRSIQAAAKTLPSAEWAAAGASVGHSVRPLSMELSWVVVAKDFPPSAERERKIWRLAFGSLGDSRQATVGFPAGSTARPAGHCSQAKPVRGTILPTRLPAASKRQKSRLFLLSLQTTW